jgi:hypothetical protein
LLRSSRQAATGGLMAAAAAGVGLVGERSSRSGSFTSMLRQRSMPVSVLASRDVSVISAAGSAGSVGGGGGFALRVAPRQGSWMARAFSMGSGSAGGSSSCSTPRGGAVQLQVLGQHESVQEDEAEGQQQEGSV